MEGKVKKCSITVRGKRCKGDPTRSRNIFGKVRVCAYHAREYDNRMKVGRISPSQSRD